MTPILSTTGGGSVRGFGRRRPVPSGPSGPSGPPTAVSATPVGTVENASNGKLNLTWTNTDATAQTRIYNGATLLATENAGTTTKSLTTLNANTAYTLTVKHYKDSIESAGSNFSQATTFRYVGDVISTAQGTYDSTNAGYSWTGTGYDKIRTCANGNNGTYTDCDAYSGNGLLHSDYVALRVRGDRDTAVTGTYTVPSGVTTVRIFITAHGGRGTYDAGALIDGNGGGAGATAARDITVSEGVEFPYSIGENGAYSYINKSGDSQKNLTCYAVDMAEGFGGPGSNAYRGDGHVSLGQTYNSDRVPRTAIYEQWGGGSGMTAGGSGYSRLYPYGNGSTNDYGLVGLLAIIENP